MKKKIFSIIIVMIFFINFFKGYTCAFSSELGDLKEGFSPVIELKVSDTSSVDIIDPGAYEPDSTTTAKDSRKLGEIGNAIIGILQFIGSILSVAILVALGIKYMVGSVEERAEYKKTMLPYFIGAIMIFGITNILAIILDIARGITNS